SSDHSLSNSTNQPNRPSSQLSTDLLGMRKMCNLLLFFVFLSHHMHIILLRPLVLTFSHTNVVMSLVTSLCLHPFLFIYLFIHSFFLSFLYVFVHSSDRY